jgi:hypothetical protein
MIEKYNWKVTMVATPATNKKVSSPIWLQPKYEKKKPCPQSPKSKFNPIF